MTRKTRTRCECIVPLLQSFFQRSKKNLMFVQDFTLIKMFEAFDENLEMGVDMLDVLGPYRISSELDQSYVSSSSKLY